MASPSGTGHEPTCCETHTFVTTDKCGCDGPVPVNPVVSPADTPERAQQVQRGLEPAETLLELVDAIRQDTVGIGACISSIRYIASSRGDVPQSILEWIDRLEAHAVRLEGKCALALTTKTEDAHGR